MTADKSLLRLATRGQHQVCFRVLSGSETSCALWQWCGNTQRKGGLRAGVAPVGTLGLAPAHFSSHTHWIRSTLHLGDEALQAFPSLQSPREGDLEKPCSQQVSNTNPKLLPNPDRKEMTTALITPGSGRCGMGGGRRRGSRGQEWPE